MEAAPQVAPPVPTLAQRLSAEAMGTALLLAIVVGSGIMAEQLAGGNVAIALLANTIATGAGLVALILTFGPISSHFNPVVTLMDAAHRALPWREVPAYIVAQICGGVAGVWITHAMFAEPILQLSNKVRSGSAQMLAEAVATFGLLLVIASVAKHRKESIAVAVGCYITAAYWFTASTSFANPAVTIARALSDSFAGIRWQDAPGFMLAQLLGLVAALIVVPRLFQTAPAPR
jgi:glycerol uptake facilitator-like aquaporin